MGNNHAHNNLIINKKKKTQRTQKINREIEAFILKQKRCT